MYHKKKYEELQPGDILGDYHSVGARYTLQELIQEHLDKEVTVSNIVSIGGDHHDFLDRLISAELCSPEGSRHVTNKLITVIQHNRWDSGWLVGWNWDCQWAGFAHIRPKT